MTALLLQRSWICLSKVFNENSKLTALTRIKIKDDRLAKRERGKSE